MSETTEKDDRIGELLYQQIRELPRVRAVSRRVGCVVATFTCPGPREAVPQHAARLPSRYGLLLACRETGHFGMGQESVFELMDGDRFETLEEIEAEYEVLDESDIGVQRELVTDGGTTVEIEVPASDVVTKQLDQRGRFTIGKEHAHATAEVAIISIEGADGS